MKKKQATKKRVTHDDAPAHRPKDPRNFVKTYISLAEKQTQRIEKLARKHKVSKAEIHRQLTAFALKNLKDISF
jgi:hypothetical protein